MKIYGSEGFPNPARVRIALAEKGATDKAEFVPVDVMDGDHRTNAFKAKTPDAVVPCLELADGPRLSQCNAITEIIDGDFEGASFAGKTRKQRAQIAMRNSRAENGLLNAVAAYIHHATPGLGPDLETYPCAEWGADQTEEAGETMAYPDAVPADAEYLAGSEFFVANIAALAGLAVADFANVEIPAALSNLTAWRARGAARPSIAG